MRTIRFLSLLILLSLVVIAEMTFSSPYAYAQNMISSGGGGGGGSVWKEWQNPVGIDEVNINGSARCKETEGITAKIVQCVKTASEEATLVFLEKFAPFMRPAILAAVVLAVVLFGVQLSSGAVPANQLGARGMILLLQIAAIFYFTTDFEMFRPLFHTIDYAANMVAAPFTLGSNIACAETSGEDSIRIWHCMDNLIMRLFALSAGATLITGITGFILAALFSGVLGVWLFFFALSAVIMMVFAVLRTINTTLMAFIGLSLLLILSPVMLPLMLFSATREYFQKWVGMIIPMMLQPVIVMTFLAIAIGPLSAIVMESANRDSFSRLINEIKAEQGTDYIKPSPSFSWQFDIPVQAADLFGIEARTVDIGKIFSFPRLNFVRCEGTAATFCFDVTVETIQRFIKLMLELLLVSYLMFTVLQRVPEFAAAMSGAAVSLARLPVPLQNQVLGAMSGAQSVMMQAAKQGGGLSTITRSIPAALTGATMGAFNIKPGKPKGPDQKSEGDKT